DRVVFAYDGLDATRRTTTVSLTRAKIEAVEDPDASPRASVVARWQARVPPGRRLTIEWVVANASEPSGASEAAAVLSSGPDPATAPARAAPAKTPRAKRRAARPQTRVAQSSLPNPGSWSRRSTRTTNCWIGR